MKSSGVFLIWAFPSLFLDFYFPLIDWCNSIDILTMRKWLETGKKKEEYVSFYDPFFRDSQCLAGIDWLHFQKAKSVPGFKPGPLGQNDIALLFAPRPMPIYEV